MNFDNFSREKIIELINDLLSRASFHHVFWFNEVKKYFGNSEAYKILKNVNKKSTEIQKNRIIKTLGVSPSSNLFFDVNILSNEQLKLYCEVIAINWLANDGIWFQEIEFNYSIKEAKHCNDLCWLNFSPFEALSICEYLKLSADSGLNGLKTALNYRLYALINKQSVHDDLEKSFVFQMDDCRVQSARKRKGLNDYPCKSAGIIEYTEFAKAIDSKIKTECVCCPPDEHLNNHYCVWKFYVE